MQNNNLENNAPLNEEPTETTEAKGTEENTNAPAETPKEPKTSSHVFTSYNPAPVPTPRPSAGGVPPKKSAGIAPGALAILLVCTVLLSVASGFFGALLATGNTTVSPLPSQNGGSTTVIYQSAASPMNGMSAEGGSTNYYTVASMVKDSIVEITTEHLVNSYFQYVMKGAGSGIIVSADGYIITNNHVIADTENNNSLARSITVRMTNGQEFKATVVGTDADTDVAVLKIDAENLPFVVVGDSDKLAIGEEVLAVGNPLGKLGGTVTNGIISALDREINVDGMKMNLLQTNAAINPGNSGGGLFNMAGELIGIVNAKSSGSGIEGLGFAIPVNDAVNIAEQLITKGYVSGRPDLGLSLYDVTSPTQAIYYGLRSLGVYIIGVEENTNDDVFQKGDRILAVDGKEISSSDEVNALLKSHEVGDTLTFTIYRNGSLMEVVATCYEYVPSLPSANTDNPFRK